MKTVAGSGRGIRKTQKSEEHRLLFSYRDGQRVILALHICRHVGWHVDVCSDRLRRV